jgi:glutathione S-transferase
MPLKLYDAAQSPNARKVRLVAAELGVALERVPVSIQRGEHRAPEYLALNPNGRVPTLDDDGFVLWESAAILRHLAAKHPEKGLVPLEPRAQAVLDQWMFWWAAHPEAALMTLVGERLVKPFLGAAPDHAVAAAADATLARVLPVLEAQLVGRDHVLGPLSLADFQAAPVLEMAPRLGVELTPYPNVYVWLQRLQTKPYWKDA